MDEPTRVDFHFDAMCPYAYRTSVWIREVRAQTGLDIDWRFFSLEEINRVEGKKHPWERPWSYGWSLMRIGAYLKRIDPALLDEWYRTSAHALHVDARKPHVPDVARELLAEMGLDPALLDEAIADPTTHDDVKADHDRVVGLAGYGVPTLVFTLDDGREHALYGPVVVDPPTGAAAVRLWKACLAWLEFPTLFELRKPKTRADWLHINDEFTPYLTARDWQTIQNEVA